MPDALEEARSAAHPPDLAEVLRDRVDPSPLRGFVVDVGAEFVLLHLLSDRIDLDGYSAVRGSDITDVRRDFQRKAFYLKALELKGLRPVVPDGIDLSGARELLQSVQERYPLVVIEQEHVDSEECVIGRIRLASETAYAMRAISPSATWEADDRTYRYSDITRVSFDGEYERTLAQVSSHAG